MFECDAVLHSSEVGVASEHLEHRLGARLGDAGAGTVHAYVLHRAA